VGDEKEGERGKGKGERGLINPIFKNRGFKNGCRFLSHYGKSKIFLYMCPYLKIGALYHVGKSFFF
jgi:hypothetical protein